MAEQTNQNAKSNEDQPMAGIQNAFSGNRNDGGPNPQFNPMGSGFMPQPQSQLPQSQFPPFPSSSGFPNQGFPTQNQGFPPSGFAFGSIQPSASSNPAFAAGYNPAAMSGPATSSYPLTSTFGQAPNSTIQPHYHGGTMVGPWTFNSNLGTVLHTRNTCSTCDAALTHILLAFADNDASFTAANQERVDHIRQAALGGNPAGGDVASLNRQIGEMNTQLGIEEREGVRTECDAFKAEADLLRAEVSRLQTLNEELASQVPQVKSPAHLGKRKRTEDRATTSTAVASSQHEDAEMVNLSDVESVDIIVGDEAQPPSGLPPIMRGPVPPEDLPDGGYRTSEDFIVYGNDASDARRNEQMGLPVPHGGGTHHLRKGVDITTALDYIALAHRVRAFDDSGVTTDGPWPAYRMCRDRYDQAVKKPVDQRNDVDRTAIANFSQPRFVEFAYGQSAKKDKGKGRKHTKKAKPSTGADQDPSSSATTRLEGLKAPTQSDPPEYWAQYHYSYPDNTGGI
ncbi:hypothetical protein BT96DRAFT_993919 [Gymnopus androsaceus JB14]|uniref:Uncharacterized protein n=1 Tax=Gymnopus androsaceus JB14 TaxID=1447944 RepID=A0A6A4HN01_9AGAR|nr:hypothetical protein BT96DRAFT_993919 [Gymnopus androsaceus JB14]